MTSTGSLCTEEHLHPFKGKLAIITGASRGIGTAIAEYFASRGANLLLNFTSESSLDHINKLVNRLTYTYESIKVYPAKANIGSPTGPSTLIEIAKQKFGDKDGNLRIDIIINNAGISENRYIQDVTIDSFTDQYHVNVLGPLLLVKEALPYLPWDRSGRIVNLSSVSSTLGMEGQSIYGGTKAALEAMTRSWARELRERCTVNAVNPGPVSTDMYHASSDTFREQVKSFLIHTPLAQVNEATASEVEKEVVRRFGGREGKPEEIAGIVGMLCLRESGWCTGSVICANGGMVFSLGG